MKFWEWLMKSLRRPLPEVPKIEIPSIEVKMGGYVMINGEPYQLTLMDVGHGPDQTHTRIQFESTRGL